MRRAPVCRLRLAAAAAICLLLAAAPSTAGGAAAASRRAKVMLRHTRLGTILVSASGRTLYEFTRDRGASNSCLRISGCAEAWPALQTRGKPVAGRGVRASLLSSIRLASGARQVTYAGHPLYLYAGDSGPGETSYVGESQFGGRWYALRASGALVR
jgi:predicted lipoprotein with Yx(FWY)xxD motif